MAALGWPPSLPAPVLAIAAGAVVSYAVGLASDDTRWMHMVNGGAPLLLGAACLGVAYLMVRKDPPKLWTPLPWFLAAWAAYYGFGPLAYVFGTPETIAYMDALYPVDEHALLRTNLLNVVGLLAVVTGTAFFSCIRLGSSPPTMSRGHDPWRVALLFLAIGVPIKYLFELPYVLGLVDYVLPGSFQYLGTFTGLAILPLSVAAGARHKWAKPLLGALVLAEIAVGVLMLAKLHIIKTILLVFLGRYAVRQDIKSLVVAGAIVVVAYVAVLSPFVNFARTILGRASAQDVNEAVTAVQSYGVQGRDTLADVLPGVQSWWTRLAYSNAQAFAMAEYDQGRPSWTFAMTPYVFLPRFVYEDKPIMTPGIEFTRLVQGTDTSSTGPGFFAAEAYWNGGWPLVVATGFFVGGVFAALGRMSVRAVGRREWLYAPLVFLAIYLGLRPDDWFVPSYVGGVLQVLLVVFLLAVLARPIVAGPSR